MKKTMNELFALLFGLLEGLFDWLDDLGGHDPNFCLKLSIFSGCFSLFALLFNIWAVLWKMGAFR